MINNRIVLAFFADTHAGSLQALCPPDIVLWKKDLDGNFVPWTPALTPEQAALWEIYDHDLQSVAEFADGDPLGVIHVGDATQGSKFIDNLMTPSIANQIIIASAVLQRWSTYQSRLLWLRLVSGTAPTHEFDENAATVLLARDLSLRLPATDVRYVDHGLVTVPYNTEGGITIDFAHHGPSAGRRKWMEFNNALWYLKDIMTKELFNFDNPPRLIVRADRHVFGVGSWSYATRRGLVESTLILLPSYQALSGYALRKTQSEYQVYHGMVAVEVIDGRLGRIMPYIRQFDLRTKEVWHVR